MTLPQLRGVLFVTLILQLIATAQLFTEPLLFTGGGPANSTMTVLLLIYHYAFQNSLGGDYGMAAALSVMLAAFLAASLLILMAIADERRRLRVRANADTPDQSTNARGRGAEGIGLCRTEHMFLGEERVGAVRRQRTAARRTGSGRSRSNPTSSSSRTGRR